MTAAIAATLTLITAIPALARPAVLTATDRGARINVRAQPSVNARSPHYGVAGDRVEVLREVAGSDGFTWYYVEFYGSGARGWVRGDFVRLTGSNNPPGATLWSHTYSCGPVTVTLRQYGRGETDYSYEARSRSLGNLFLRNGYRDNTGSAWRYSFTNGDTTYEVTDAWGRTPSDPGFARLRVYESGRETARYACDK